MELAKNVFSVHGVDAHGKGVLRKTLTQASKGSHKGSSKGSSKGSLARGQV